MYILWKLVLVLYSPYPYVDVSNFIVIYLIAIISVLMYTFPLQIADAVLVT